MLKRSACLILIGLFVPLMYPLLVAEASLLLKGRDLYPHFVVGKSAGAAEFGFARTGRIRQRPNLARSASAIDRSPEETPFFQPFGTAPIRPRSRVSLFSVLSSRSLRSPPVIF